MLTKIHISSKQQIITVYVTLALVTLAVLGQVTRYEFVNIDDPIYVTENSHIKSGITLDGFRWAFTTTHAEFWHPLTWLSLMLDHQLYGLNAGAYHMTNLILHVLSTLLLFWLFQRMTGAVWRSAFVAALFALHPLHVESVVWVAERKDVLSVFFWMLTLCLYVYYTEKPDIKRYLVVLFSFILALMSKSIVITLPLIMILLDYWPLKRLPSQKNNVLLRQFKEKIIFFILSGLFMATTILSQPKSTVKDFPLCSRLANAVTSFMIYLEKTFWPHDMAVFYPFSVQIPGWHVAMALFLFATVSVIPILTVKRRPYLFVGWLWYVVTLLPVIGIIQVGNHAMADRYHYLPSIGIAIMLAWGIPDLIKEKSGKRILFFASLIFLAFMSLFTWRQCFYWQNNFILFNHALMVTKDNYIAYDGLGTLFFEEGKIEDAIDDFNQAIVIKPDYGNAYKNRGIAYFKLGNYQQAVKDLNKALSIRPDNALCYYYKGNIDELLGHDQSAINNYSDAIHLKKDYIDAYINRGGIYFKLGQFQLAIDDYNEVIHLNQYHAEAYNNRAFVLLSLGKKEPGCLDAKKACDLGHCRILEGAKIRGLCH